MDLVVQMLEHGKRIRTRTHVCTHSANVPKKCHLKQHKIDVCWNHSNDHAMVTLLPFRCNCVSLRLNKMSFCFRRIFLKCPMFTWLHNIFNAHMNFANIFHDRLLCFDLDQVIMIYEYSMITSDEYLFSFEQ